MAYSLSKNLSVPTTIFIDTSVFDESMYNFESASMVAFKGSIAESEITLLLPDPTQREIRRHMHERADAAVATLEAAARKTPFLWKLPNWPLANKITDLLAYELREIAERQLK